MRKLNFTFYNCLMAMMDRVYGKSTAQDSVEYGTPSAPFREIELKSYKTKQAKTAAPQVNDVDDTASFPGVKQFVALMDGLDPGIFGSAEYSAILVDFSDPEQIQPGVLPVFSSKEKVSLHQDEE